LGLVSLENMISFLSGKGAISGGSASGGISIAASEPETVGFQQVLIKGIYKIGVTFCMGGAKWMFYAFISLGLSKSLGTGGIWKATFREPSWHR
jgi:hypothetical protein